MANVIGCNPFNLASDIGSPYKGYWYSCDTNTSVTLPTAGIMLIAYTYMGTTYNSTGPVPANNPIICYKGSAASTTLYINYAGVEFSTDGKTVTTGQYCRATFFVVTSFEES